MSEPGFISDNRAAIEAAQAAHERYGMGPALTAAVQSVFQRVQERGVPVELQNRDIINGLSAFNLKPSEAMVDGERITLWSAP